MATTSSDSFDYDLLVLGAGSGGLATAKRAASYGARVAIVEQSRVGGTCVIRGCIPKKLMVYAGELGHALHDAPDYGWSRASASLDWSLLVHKRDEAVASLERTHEEHLRNAGVELLRGHGRIVAPQEVDIDGRRLCARLILVATGSTPVYPKIAGREHAITSDGFFELEAQPRTAIIVGGGYIAVEFASILTALGTQVFLVLRRELPLRGFDEDLRRELLESLVEQGVDVRARTTVASISRSAEAVRVTLESAEGTSGIEADAVMVYAIGRRPNTHGLGLEGVGVRVGERGEVVVDVDGATAVPSIVAVGDVTDRLPLTPVAIQAGRAMADRLFGGKATRMRYDGVPTAVFCEPPIGTVGLTEREAVDRLGGDRIRIYKSRFTPLFHTLTERKTRTLVKLVVDTHDDRVLGCHVIGHDAPEIIQGFAVAMKAGATKADFDATVGIHPSTAEELVTLT
jgi:glutathione reductase (NADPH)